jgi:hypothetical protein
MQMPGREGNLSEDLWDDVRERYAEIIDIERWFEHILIHSEQVISAGS